MNLASWANFAVASVGIAGALAGLLFVAISLNLDFMLENGHLPARAATALGTLLSIAILNLMVLVPHQTALGLGVTAAVLGVLLAVRAWLTFHVTLRRRQDGDPLAWAVQPLLINLLTPLTLGALSCWTLLDHDTRALAAVTVCGLVTAVWEAWVLVIEIRR